MRILQLPQFRAEIARFPLETREDVWLLVDRYLRGERLPSTSFKTFNLGKKVRVQEFKVKDFRGNWRAISCISRGGLLVFVHAYHKKSQTIDKKARRVALSRIRSIPHVA